MAALLRQLFYIAALAIAVTLVGMKLRGPQGIPEMMQKRDALRHMERENLELKLEIERKQKLIHNLEENPTTRDRAIRDGLKKQKDNETTIFLGDDDPSPDQPAPPQQH